MARLDRLGWAIQNTYEVGPFLLGVRVSDPELGEALAQSLSAHLVPDVIAPANYSLLVPDGGVGVLYQGYQSMTRTRDPSRLIRAFLAHLGSHQKTAVGLAIGMGVVQSRDRAVLAPRSISNLPHRLVMELNERELQLLDRPWVDVDPERGTMQISESPLEMDPFPLQAWIGPDADLAPVQPGDYPLAGIVLDDPALAPSPSSLYWVVRLLRRTANLPKYGARQGIDAVLGLLSRVPVHLVAGGVREQAAAVIGAF
ncbi:MAG: hypothetical protein ACRDWA_00040 [Acidimicrobiia bacterium]